MIKVKNSNIEIPYLYNADAEIDKYNRVIVKMADGYEMWDKQDYIDSGPEEDKIYYTYLSLSPDRDFSLLIEKDTNIPTVEEKALAYDILMGVAE